MRRRTKVRKSRCERGQIPVRPADLVVLAVGVVVALLRASDFVAAANHRDPDREHQRRHQVAALPIAQVEDAAILGRAFDAAIPAQVVVLAVLVVLAVGVVVLDVVADEVGHREAVVRGHEVDARVRPPAALLVQVAAARQPRRQLRHAPIVSPPEAADGVAVLAVPLRPLGGEVADLVAALAEVPGLGDELDLRQHRVLVNDVEERAQLVDRVQLARERAREVEAEAVDVHLEDPVAQAVHDELQHARAAHVERVARAGEVLVVARVVRQQPVVGAVVDAAQRQRRPEVIALGGVVVDDVEDDFEVGGVEGTHHDLELAHGFERQRREREAHVGREVRERVVAPVVVQAAAERGGPRRCGDGPASARRR